MNKIFNYYLLFIEQCKVNMFSDFLTKKGHNLID